MSTLSLPNQFMELEQEEMMYLEGGWSGATFSTNLKHLWSGGSSQALKYAGFTWGSIAAAANYGYVAACAEFGVEITALCATVGGVVGGLIGAGGAAAAIWYLGEHKVW